MKLSRRSSSCCRLEYWELVDSRSAGDQVFHLKTFDMERKFTFDSQVDRRKQTTRSGLTWISTLDYDSSMHIADKKNNHATSCLQRGEAFRPAESCPQFQA